MTAVFLTIDTEIAWRHHAAGLDPEIVEKRSIEPAGVGLAWHLELLARYGLKATFFVDPMPARIYGVEPFKRIVDAILAAGQEVQLHLHPNWTRATLCDRDAHALFELIDYDAEAQRELLSEAASLLMAAGAPRPIAFRAGSYAANDDTLAALASLGIVYDSSHNGAHHPWPSAIGLPPEQISPIMHRGVLEVPVSTIEDTPGVWRNFQICALSTGEMRAAIDHAIAARHVALTIVSHSFELADRTGLKANRTHLRRFETLCRLLSDRRELARTTHFADRPALALDASDKPLPASRWRRGQRQAEQLWSNLVSERGV